MMTRITRRHRAKLPQAKKAIRFWLAAPIGFITAVALHFAAFSVGFEKRRGRSPSGSIAAMLRSQTEARADAPVGGRHGSLLATGAAILSQSAPPVATADRLAMIQSGVGAALE